MLQLSHNSLRCTANALCTCLTVLLLTLSSGCQLAPKEKPIKWPWKKDDTKPLPERMLPVWTDTVLHQPNQPGIRGFGGRIYFYAKDNTEPIEIDGSLAVYVFDADDISVNSQKPLRKFVFTADQFNEHMSKTSIGPSYSVWLPWGEVGGPPRRLSLIARFEGREGSTTISDPTIKLLPGVPEKDQDEESTADTKPASKSPFRLSSHQNKNGVKPKSDEDTAEVKQDTQSDIKSDIKTIDLPPSFQRHLRGTTTEVKQPADAKSSSPTESTTNAATTNATTTEPEAGSTAQLSQSADAPAATPMTTQVYDYRTRRRNGTPAFDAAKNDIRQGRWINSIARD